MKSVWSVAPWLLWATLANAAEPGFECLIEPSQVVEIRAPVDGVIATIGAQRGDTIHRGQVLLELKSGSERAVVDLARYRARMEGKIMSARNRIDYAGKKLARLVDLQRDNFSSAQARDEAEAEKHLAEAELQSAIEDRELARIELQRAQEQLALRTVTAPFNGVVIDRMLNPGDLAEAGSGRKPVLKVAQIDPMRADVALPAAFFGKVHVGSHAQVTAQVGGAHFAAVVQGVDKVIDAASSTFVARLELPNHRSLVPGGSRCNATIDGVTAPGRPPRL
jgi:RND family efflux transporter MFP subunit